MIAALWMLMGRALKSPTGFLRWGSFGEVSFFSGWCRLVGY